MTGALGGDVVLMTNMATTVLPEEKAYPAELRALLERAGAGDAAALPALRRAFDEAPELAALLGDLAAHAEQAILTLAAGDNLAAREAIARQAAALRDELTQAGASPLERLLIQRVVLCWLAVNAADIEAAHLLRTVPGAAPAVAASHTRLGQAQQRLLAAGKALAVVRKLLRPAVSPTDLLRPVGEVPAPAGPRGRRPTATFPGRG
jgi:hypothetical protein